MREMRRLGAKIWKVAKDKGVSIDDLADIAKVRYAEMRCVLNGTLILPYDSIKNLASTLDVSVESLLKISDEEYAKCLFEGCTPENIKFVDNLLDYIEDMILWDSIRAEQRMQKEAVR